MKRFIRYLYEYEEGRRIRNVGFVKVDQQEQECMIHIYGKGLHLNMGETLELYLFYEENGLCVGVWQGEITNINPAVNYRCIIRKKIPERQKISLKYEALC